jgi:hypothetical protein
MKQIRNVWITHHLQAPSGGAPTLRVDAVMTPESTSYTTLGSLIATSHQQRRHVWVRRRALGVGLRIAQVGASADTDLAEIEFESRPLTRSRRG